MLHVFRVFVASNGHYDLFYVKIFYMLEGGIHLPLNVNTRLVWKCKKLGFGVLNILPSRKLQNMAKE